MYFDLSTLPARTRPFLNTKDSRWDKVDNNVKQANKQVTRRRTRLQQRRNAFISLRLARGSTTFFILALHAADGRRKMAPGSAQAKASLGRKVPPLRGGVLQALRPGRVGSARGEAANAVASVGRKAPTRGLRPARPKRPASQLVGCGPTFPLHIVTLLYDKNSQTSGAQKQKDTPKPLKTHTHTPTTNCVVMFFGGQPRPPSASSATP